MARRTRTVTASTTARMVGARWRRPVFTVSGVTSLTREHARHGPTRTPATSVTAARTPASTLSPARVTPHAAERIQTSIPARPSRVARQPLTIRILVASVRARRAPPTTLTRVTRRRAQEGLLTIHKPGGLAGGQAAGV